MASSGNSIISAFLLALTLSSIMSSSLAARQLLQTTQPFIPNIPKIPINLPNTLPRPFFPLPSIPTLPQPNNVIPLPTNLPNMPMPNSLPPLPSTNSFPNIPSIPNIIPSIPSPTP